MATTQTANQTVVGVFNSMDQANQAVRDLENAGFSRESVSVVANKTVHGETSDRAYDTDRTDAVDRGDAVDRAEAKTPDVAADAGIGAALGGVGGLLLSFAGLAIPGIGPILAAGPIIAALSGAGIGAVAGGIIGALTETGIPEEDAKYYAEGVRRGHVLVTVHTTGDRAEAARDILDSSGAEDVNDRVSNWRDRGWSDYDSGSAPMSADEIRREREYYSASDRERYRLQNDEATLRGSGTDLPDSNWPHERAHDIDRSLTGAEASNAADDAARTSANAGFRNDPDTTLESSRAASSAERRFGDAETRMRDDASVYSDATENNVRRTDPAVARAESGFERAKDSAVESARRMRARIYENVKH